MSILCVKAPAFAVAVERLREPRLLRYPVVVAAQNSPRAPILSVSSEAYELGVRKGITFSEVRKIDRRIKIVPANHTLYQKAHHQLQAVMDRFTPFYQSEQLGSFFLDMTGSQLLFGKNMHAAAKIQTAIREAIDLHPTIGAAENKLVSRIAAKVVRPEGVCDIFPGNEAAFLAPLELTYLPAIREMDHPELFRELAIQKIGDLANIPTTLMTQLFGKKGELLQRQAQGIDQNFVEAPQHEALLQQEIILSPETNHDSFLLTHLWEAVEHLARQLRERRIVTAEIRLQGMYADHQIISKFFSVSPPTQLDFALFERLSGGWRKFLERRVSLKSLILTFAQLSPEFRQISWEAWFQGESTKPTEQRQKKLLEALDHLRKKHGPSVVRFTKG